MTQLSHEIHTSERKSYRGCRRRWDWHFRQNWTPQGMAPPLEFGIAFHKAMEVIYDPETWDMDKEVVGELAVKTFVDECQKQKKKYLLESNEPALEDAVEEEYKGRVELGKGMLRYYYREQLPKHPDGFRPVKVEIPFEVPIMHPDTGQPLMCKCDKCWDMFNLQQKKDAPVPVTVGGGFNNPTEDWVENISDESADPRESWPGLPVTYAGRIDCIGIDENGDYWIIDWKTAAQISKDEEFLYLDDQIGSYVWALRMILNLPVRGFIYHEQKKGYPKPPEQNKQRRLGRLYSVNKQADTDYETYLATVKEHDADAWKEGLYDDHLAFLRNEGTVFYKRFVIFKTDEELEEIGINIGHEAIEMTDPNIRVYPNAGRFACKFCAFRQPCLGKNRRDDYTYTLQTLFRKEPPYWYRQARGASTESKGGE